MLTVGSLFSGIGGLDLGLERAGMRVLWQCESDPYCRAVLRKHWPDVPCYEDVKTLAYPERAGREVAGHPEHNGQTVGSGQADQPARLSVDVLAGGFPCQPVSLAGVRRGNADERWLWPEYARLIRLLRPRYALMENVPGLLVGGGMGEVLGDLAEMGYDAQWGCVAAADVGAPHLRKRVFIVAYPRRVSDERWGVSRDMAGTERAREAETPERERLRNAPVDRGQITHPDGGRQQERSELDGEAPQNASDGSSRRRRADGLRDHVADAQEHGRQPWRTRDATQDAGGRQSDRGSIGTDVSDSDGSGRVEQRRPEPIFAALASLELGSWWEPEPDVGRVAHGVPSRVDRLRALGNAIVPQVAEVIGRLIVNDAA